MQPGTGHYSSYGGATSDASFPPYNPSYVSAPPYTGAGGGTPAYYTDNTSYQNQPYNPPASQAPVYSPSPASLADAMGGLSVASSSAPPSSYASTVPPSTSVPVPPPAYTPVQSSAPPPSSYAPTVPSYDQSYGPAAAPASGYGQQTGGMAPYDQSSYAANSMNSYDPSPSYGSKPHSMAPPPPQPVKTGYDSNPMPLQGYDYGSYGIQHGQSGNYGVPQSQVNNYDQGGSLYSSGPVRDYDRPAYNTAPNYDSTGFKSNGLDRGSSRSSYDYDDLGLGDVYAYDGGHSEPYGARGTGSSSWGVRDSYSSSYGGSYGSSGGSKLPKAVPKVDNEDKNNGVQKYRVKLLSDYGSGSGPQDVLCQIGLDGVRMISPSTNRTVRIYPLETITRWEVNEPAIFTFWAKSAVDIEPRRIRLQSGSYTTNAILDTLTAACVQFSEMVGRDGGVDSSKEVEKTLEQSSDKKKPGLVSWISLRNKAAAPEEKQHWVPDEAVTKCSACASDFGAFLRRHHCRNCGDVFCDKCTSGRTALTADEDAPIVRVCDRCLAEVTQRLSNAKEISSRPIPPPRSHEDLARKLQEEMERNSKKSSTSNNSNSSRDKSGQTSVLNCNTCGSISLVNGNNTRCPACGVDSSGSRSGRGSYSSSDGKRMREVACPTCTVHLQVQVPSSGTETVECGVCQHPFLVSAH